MPAFDFITKPINFNDLEVTLTKSLKYVQELRQSVLSLRENNIMRMFVDDNALTYMLAKMQDNTLNSSEYINASIVTRTMTSQDISIIRVGHSRAHQQQSRGHRNQRSHDHASASRCWN